MTGLATVIPLRHKRMTTAEVPPLPEPVQLYGLTVLAFLLHVPRECQDGEVCRQCHDLWPCAQVRLAFRNREAF